jgi:RimJ/RimL family protein N-acetyltransferase
MTADEDPRDGRVRLCPFEGEFWEKGLSWYNDPEIIATTSDDPNPLTREQFRTLIERDLLNENARVFGLRESGGAPIGVLVLRSIDPVHRGVELHLTIGEAEYRGRGYGSEAIRLAVAFAFERLGMHRVVSTPFADNDRMIRCLARCGFEREGTLRHALCIGGRFIDVAVMGLLNPREVDP